VRRLFGLFVVLVIAIASCSSNGSPAGSSGGSSSGTDRSADSYVPGFRQAYLTVVTKLNDVTAACARSDMTVALLPACGKRVRACRLAIARLATYVTSTPPPPDAAAALRSLAASLHDMHRAFGALAARITHRDLAGFLAMAGLGGPIDTPIQAFSRAALNLGAKFPGTSLPLPG
jgi:hypothetical protein